MGSEELHKLEEVERLMLGWMRVLTSRGNLSPLNADDANRMADDLKKMQVYMRSLINHLQEVEFNKWQETKKAETPPSTQSTSKASKSASAKTRTVTS